MARFRYRIAAARSAGELAEIVEREIGEGWHLVGGVTVSHDSYDTATWAQALALKVTQRAPTPQPGTPAG